MMASCFTNCVKNVFHYRHGQCCEKLITPKTQPERNMLKQITQSNDTEINDTFCVFFFQTTKLYKMTQPL